MDVKKALWSIFGNDDDPVVLSFYLPGWPFWIRQALWLFWRNPLHNLVSYRWGLSKRVSHQVSLYGPHVWAPEGFVWNFGVTFYNGQEYPFISRRGKKWERYPGWRLPGGGLGAAFRRRQK